MCVNTFVPPHPQNKKKDGILSSKLKIAKVVTIIKEGSTDSVHNTRPIALLSVFFIGKEC